MARSASKSSRTSSRNLAALAEGPVLGRTGAGRFGLGLGAKAVRAAADPLPDAVPFLLVTAFFATVGAIFLAGGAVFFAAGTVFLAAGAAFLAVAAFLAPAGGAFLAGGAVFFAAGAVFLVVVAAFFTTGAAFFLGSEGRFLAVAATLPDAFFFPARDEVAALERDPDARLPRAPLLDGVIVPSYGPGKTADFPGHDLVRGAGDDTGPPRLGQHCGHPQATGGLSFRGVGALRSPRRSAD